MPSSSGALIGAQAGIVGAGSINTGPEQYLRKYSLIVYKNGVTGAAAAAAAGIGAAFNNALDLSNLRFRFAIKRSSGMTPNTGDIRVYNLTPDTALSLLALLSPTTANSGLLINNGGVILQAGYEGNYGVIFQGNIKQIILGRESATDTFVDIIAGDGDLAYNFAVVNQTLAKGSTQADQINAAVNTTSSKGVGLGSVGSLPASQLPRGKVMFGNARNYLRQVALNTNQQWSIQDETIEFVPLKSYAPGERVILTSKTGLIGTPQQTNEGVNVKCLINPLIRINGRIDISEATVQNLKVDLNNPTSPVNNPAPLTQDGVYYVLALEHTGDTRGVEWYTSLICLNVDVTTNPINAVQPGFG
jgi:hypothetical protein